MLRPEVEKWVMGVRKKMKEPRYPAICSLEGQCDVREEGGVGSTPPPGQVSSGTPRFGGVG